MKASNQPLPQPEYPIKEEKKGCVAWRFVIAFFGFFAMTNSYALRSHLSVTLVAMVNFTSSATSKSSNECVSAWSNDTSSDSTSTGEFDWDQHLQGLVTGAFYWGYLLPQIMGGRLAELYSAKLVILVGGAIGTLATFLGPIAANTNVGFFIATRVLCGLGLSVFQPCLHSLIARWCPPSERSVFSSIVYSGNQFGVVISMPVAGLLCQYVDWTWPFYVFGILSAVWLLLWIIFVYNTPDEHPWISKHEYSYIHESLALTLDKQHHPKVPWKAIFATPAVWALICSHFGYNWGFYTLLTNLPTYMENVLGFDIGKNGALSALPYIVMMAVGYVSSGLADFVLRKGYVQRVVVIRKSFNTVALYGSALSLLIITFLKCQTIPIYILLILAVAFDGGTYAGFQINHVDLSPNFAGTLQGITNTAACIPGIISPYITGVLTEGQETHESWSKVFYISMAVLFLFGTIYLILGRATLQPWNAVHDEDSDDDSVYKPSSSIDPIIPVYESSYEMEDSKRF